MNDRRRYLARTCQLAVTGALAGWLGDAARAADPARVTIAVPGPGNLLYMPLTLARKIGADRQEGVEFDLRYVGGGPQGMTDLRGRNVDFAAAGLPAAALQRLAGNPLQVIAPLSRVPAYTLVVRAALKRKVKKVADLAGLVVGVKGRTPGGRSTSQLFTEYALSLAGLPPDRVNYVAVGQAYDNQHAALSSGAVDALMGDEPFASRIVRAGGGYILQDFHDLETTRRTLGGLFLNGVVMTRDDFAASRPDLVEKTVKALQRTLVWIERHSAREVVDALAPGDVDERESLFEVLKARKTIYAPDGRFSTSAIETTERFFHAMETSPQALALRLNSFIGDRWAGRTA